MREIRKVRLIDLQYDGWTKYISVVGREQLDAFFRSGSVNCYDAESAQKEYEVEIDCDFDDVDKIVEKAKAAAEDEEDN